MKFDPEKHHRQSIRLRNYDYSQPGYYFLIICTHKKQCWLGEIKNDRMYLNQIGKIVAREWLHTPKIRPNVQLDEWVIMPNHLHGIVIINEHISGLVDEKITLSGARNEPLRQESNSISSFVAGFKSAVSKRINLLRDNRDIPIWQRNYYESIIRDENALRVIREYIFNNSFQWKKDPDNQENDQSGQVLDLDLYF
jgi:REP element-mobilizing transposase RayT